MIIIMIMILPPPRRGGMTYGDAVDLDRAAFANASALLNDGAKKKMKASFFLPRGHPARAAADPPPARWREVLDAIVRHRKTAPPASVDAFHGFLLSLRGDPDARFQALVAALLSVQCRDAVALQATERLREALGGAITVDRVRRADVSAVERATRSCNFKTTKARYVRECADAIATAPEFRGRVPRDVPGLMRLPGVGPKLAHLVASVAFGEGGGARGGGLGGQSGGEAGGRENNGRRRRRKENGDGGGGGGTRRDGGGGWGRDPPGWNDDGSSRVVATWRHRIRRGHARAPGGGSARVDLGARRRVRRAHAGAAGIVHPEVGVERRQLGAGRVRADPVRAEEPAVRRVPRGGAVSRVSQKGKGRKR